MMRRLLGAALLPLAATLAMAQSPEPATLSFPNYGFSIKGLPGAPGPSVTQVMAIYLPAENGFAPNVNVQIQPYTGTRDEYAQISQAQFDGAGFTVIETKKPSDQELIFEYTGSAQDRNVHWYSRAVFTPGKVYLVTATCLDSNWPANEASLKASVDSLKPE